MSKYVHFGTSKTAPFQFPISYHTTHRLYTGDYPSTAVISISSSFRGRPVNGFEYDGG